MNKRIISFLLVFTMLLSCLPLNVFAVDSNACTFKVDNVYGTPGSTVDVEISIANNPGILGASFSVAWDNGLTLLSTESGSAFADLTYQQPSSNLSGCNFVWYGSSISKIIDGCILKLSFKVSETATDADTFNINVDYDERDIIDQNKSNVKVNIQNGSVRIVTYKPGDVTGDKRINTLDLIKLSQYISDRGVDPNGYNAVINESAADVNDDGRINPLDLILISQYISDGCITDPNGYNVTLKPSTPKCEHNLQATVAKAATCTEDGNKAYWYCSKCDRYFLDKDGISETTLEATVIPASHNLIYASAVAPTTEKDGNIEHWRCSVCNKYFLDTSGKNETTADKIVIGKLAKEESTVIYNVSGSDTYLAGLNVENPNPFKFESSKGLILNDLVAPEGYIFKGWQTASGTPITEIAPGASRQIVVNAVWEIVTYEVSFVSDLVPVEPQNFTVNRECVLPTPKLDGYIFAGWSDDDGDVIKVIPKGTVGSKKYTANWLSERNQAWSKQKLEAPIIIEDEETNTILFTYEIGEIRNVPAYVIEDFGYINSNGISKTVSKTISTTVSESLMKTYTNTVSNSTVNSYGWTLSNGWSNSTIVNEEWCKQQGKTKEEVESYSKSDTNGWYVSSGSSGSSTTQTLKTKDTYDLNTNTSNKTNGGSSSNSSTRASSLSNSLTVESKLEVETEVKTPFINGSATGSFGASDTFSSSSSDSNTDTNSSNYSLSSGSSNQGGSISHTGTNTTSSSSWNSESGYNGSSTVSKNSSISNAISESVSNRYGYGKTYINNGSESSTQGVSSTDSSSDTYSSSVTYSTASTEEQTVSYTTTNTISGYHRWIMVDTAHVFAVVGYDIASASYFVTTYSVMENDLKPYEDYSYSSGKYDDNQNSYIGFEVPYDTIVNYVGNRVGESEGLEVNSSGVIMAYNGSDENVVIPEYKVIDNRDGSKSVIKIVGISENAFKGNNKIKSINMSTFIENIPDNAFKDCSSLVEVQSCVKTIGKNAFSGCIAMKAVMLGYGVESIGENAFDSAEDLTVYAANENVVDATVKSGAKKITVYITDKCNYLNNRILETSSSTEEFVFNGLGKTYYDLYIVSTATKTIINRADFVSTGRTPLNISSAELELNQVVVTSLGFALMVTSDNCEIALYGESDLNAENGNALLCKNIKLSQIDKNYFSSLNVNGNVLVCGDIKGENYLSVTNGSIIKISQDDFDKYVIGTYKVNFNTNGGSLSETSKTVYYGHTYGDLPTPTRDYFYFVGWFTQTDGKGQQIFETTIFDSAEDIILYAFWSQKEPSGWVKASEMPAGAEVINRKYSYTLTSYTTSSSSSLSGWTKYDTKSAWGDYGSWSGWSDTKVTASDSRQVETRQAVASTNYKTVYHYFRYAVNKTGGYGNTSATSSYPNYFTYDFDSPLEANGTMNGYSRYKYWYSSSNYISVYACSPYTTQEVVSYNYKTQYRYRDRSLVYTYYYKKAENKESTTNPSGQSNVSNVQEWVQYRAK